MNFTLYCPKCRAYEPAVDAAARLGNATSASWLLRNWKCFCPAYIPRKFA